MFSPAKRELTRTTGRLPLIDDVECKTAESPVQSTGESRLGKRKRDNGTTGIGPVERQLLSFKSREAGLAVLFIFRPCAVITRSQLPLSFLDPLGSVTMPKFLTSHVPQLELPQDICETTASQILLAECSQTQSPPRLFAIEKVEQNIYTICALVIGVTLQDFGQTVPSQWTSCQGNISNSEHKGRWWFPTRISIDSAIQEKESSTVLKDHQQSVLGSECIIENTLVQDDAITLDADEMWTKFVAQYLDMLYLSKTPLSYFVKGPLGRIRNAYTQQDRVAHFIDRLKNMVLPFALFDRKYKQELGLIIEAVVAGEVVTPGIPKSHKKSEPSARRRMAKIGKQGLYKMEGLIIEKYWGTCLSQRITDFSKAALAKHIQHVQTREELMQLIILLEILALTEASAKSDRPAALEDAAQRDSAKVGAKKATALDMMTHLGTMIDRLCIRQAVFIEVEETKKNGLGLDPIVTERSSSSDDHLKEFFAEVIIPFYSARLRHIVKDFGARVGFAATSTKNANSVPPRKSRDPLRRVNTDMNTGTRSYRSLSRSATDGLLQVVRGDSRSPAPERRNSTDGRRTLSRSSSVGQAGALSGREIDLGAMKRFNEAKLKPKPDANEELRYAIAALKKPNRDVSAREYADAASQRASLAAVAGKKLNHSGRRPFQVQATPIKAKRTFGANSAFVHDMYEDEEATVVRSGPSFSAVPSSAHRPMVHAKHSTFSPGQMLPPAQHGSTVAIGDTPRVVRSTHDFGFAEDRGSDAPSPSVGRRARNAVTYAERDEQTKAEPVSLASIRKRLDFTDGRDCEAAPVVASAVEDLSAAAGPADKVEKPCIYKSLGWEEDYADETA